MSGDFDPRLLWTRRQAVTALGAGVAAAGLSAGGAAACEAERAGRGGRRPVLVSGAEIAAPDARRLAHLAGATLAAIPAETDPLRFWTAQVAPHLSSRAGSRAGSGAGSGAPVLGVTRWADFLVLRGAAAESRLRVRFQTGAGARSPADSPELEALAERLEAALAERARTAGRIGWILA